MNTIFFRITFTNKLEGNPEFNCHTKTNDGIGMLLIKHAYILFIDPTVKIFKLR